jgi:hypothetical protein
MTDQAINSLRYHATVDHTSSGHTHVCHICARYRENATFTCYDDGCRDQAHECPDCQEEAEDRVITEINRRAA